MAFLHIQNITKCFGSTTVLNDVSFDVAPHEFICLLGPSGCGKSTLLRIIAGLQRADSGRIVMDGADLSKTPAGARRFGVVFQSYALFPNMTARQNIAYGLQGRKLTRTAITHQVARVIELTGLGPVCDQHPAELSGGEQQRVALARALVLKPRLLLLDEPLSALDANVRVYLRAEIRRIQRKSGTPVIMVTHDQEEALTMADRIVVMSQARVEQSGTPREIYDTPANPFVSGFIGAVNFLALKDGRQKAIRPEDVRISKTPLPGGISSTVGGWEYRGAYYRLSVYPKSDHVAVAGKMVYADVSAAAFYDLGLDSAGAAEVPCYLFLPPERVHIYGAPNA